MRDLPACLRERGAGDLLHLEVADVLAVAVVVAGRRAAAAVDADDLTAGAAGDKDDDVRRVHSGDGAAGHAVFEAQAGDAAPLCRFNDDLLLLVAEGIEGRAALVGEELGERDVLISYFCAAANDLLKFKIQSRQRIAQLENELRQLKGGE